MYCFPTTCLYSPSQKWGFYPTVGRASLFSVHISVYAVLSAIVSQQHPPRNDLSICGYQESASVLEGDDDRSAFIWPNIITISVRSLDTKWQAVWSRVMTDPRTYVCHRLAIFPHITPNNGDSKFESPRFDSNLMLLIQCLSCLSKFWFIWYRPIVELSHRNTCPSTYLCTLHRTNYFVLWDNFCETWWNPTKNIAK